METVKYDESLNRLLELAYISIYESITQKHTMAQQMKVLQKEVWPAVTSTGSLTVFHWYCECIMDVFCCSCTLPHSLSGRHISCCLLSQRQRGRREEIGHIQSLPWNFGKNCLCTSDRLTHFLFLNSLLKIMCYLWPLIHIGAMVRLLLLF